ncbi:armadillo-type protein [Mycena rebaudengoi]|nr:armadillo-type protein [Mycena rebaudengoi]
MPRLARQPTRESYFSYWSDSNSRRIANPIHAAAKPLTKFMYHLDVRNFIKRQRGIPLSAETMEIYSSYLGCEYVAHLTKAEILWELQGRAGGDSEARLIVDLLALVVTSAASVSQISNDLNGARAVMDANALNFVPDLLQSPNSQVRRNSCWMLGRLAFRDFAVESVLAVTPCARLVSLLRDTEILVVGAATWALSHISSHLNGAKAVIDANALDFVPDLLQSPDSEWSQSGGDAMRAPCGSAFILVVGAATWALSEISRDLNGARAVMDANALSFVPDLLQSPDSEVRTHACCMLGGLAFRDFAVESVLAVTPCALLVALLFDTEILVVGAATWALSHISSHLNGAKAVMDANALDFVPDLLQIPNSQVRCDACWMLGRLAMHNFAVLAVQPCARLVALLRDTDVLVIRGAIFALSQIGCNKQGVEATMDATALDSLPALLQDPSFGIQRYACIMMGQVARYNRLYQST